MLQGPICSGFGSLHAMEKNLFIISGVVRGICCSSDELPSLSAPEGWVMCRKHSVVQIKADS